MGKPHSRWRDAKSGMEKNFSEAVEGVLLDSTGECEDGRASARNGRYWRSLLTAVCEKAVGSYSKDVACVYVIWLAKKAAIIAYLDRVPDLLCVINVLWDLYGALIPIEFDF